MMYRDDLCNLIAQTGFTENPKQLSLAHHVLIVLIPVPPVLSVRSVSVVSVSLGLSVLSFLLFAAFAQDIGRWP